MAKNAARPGAVIDIGASALRLVVAEVSKNGDWKHKDTAVKPSPLGRDVFTTGYISRETHSLVMRILAGFTELIAGWNIPLPDVRVIATSAVREAKNRDTFIEQVFLRTGLRIQILSGIEENHLMYLAVEYAVRNLKDEMARSNNLIIEAGAGSTDLMLLRRGKVIAAHSLPLGTLRREKFPQPDAGIYGQMERSLREVTRGAQGVLDAEFRFDRVKYFMAAGRSARLAAEKAGVKVETHYSLIDKKDFLDFTARIQKYTVEECVRMLQISYYEAEGLIPSLVVYKYFFEKTSAQKILVPDVSLREGVLLRFALDTQVMKKRFFSQVMTSAVSLGRKFRFDEEHSLFVAKMACTLFDGLAAEHGLDTHARILLEASAILHDIGSYIGNARHDRHGRYIIANSEIFGFSPGDIKIIAFIVRLHRALPVQASPRGFASLPREERIRVLKIAAILRVADALDRAHTQKISSLNIEKKADEIILRAGFAGESPIDRSSLQTKSELFEEIFGYRISLEDAKT